jgi:hypothetical protein
MAFGSLRSGEWCASSRYTPAEQDVSVAELSGDLFWLGPLFRHGLPPLGKGSVAPLPLDQFSGGKVRSRAGSSRPARTRSTWRS